MLRVVDLLALPAFEKFRLVNRADGLYNKITTIDILDWESPKEIEETFSKNSIVFNTMYMTGSDFEKADECMRTLMKMRVGAIAIKTSRDDVCSKEIIELADYYRIPIFLYEKEYLEDLIYIVRSAMLANDSNGVALEHLKALMISQPGDIVTRAQKLNPQFKNEILCMCCIPMNRAETELDREWFDGSLDKALDDYRRTLPQNMPNPQSHHVVIRCGKCIIIILSGEGGIEDSKAAVENFGIESKNFAIGVSRPKENLYGIKDAVEEALMAAMDGLLFGEEVRSFEEVGANGLILSAMEIPYFKGFYEKILKLLTEYDDRHDTELLNTLMVYIDSEWDITLAAQRLYQHGNTTRYRIGKIRQLTGVDEGHDGNMQLLAFARMHKLNVLTGEGAFI